MFDASNLSALAYANGFTQWHYKTHDSWPEVARKGYFDPGNHLIKPDDMVILTLHSEARDFGFGHKVGFIYCTNGSYIFVCC